MRNKICLAAVAIGILGFVYALTLAPRPAVAGDGKNLKVLSNKLSKKEIKKIMKVVGKSVDKSCDECHDLEDFSKDTPMKKKAREMFKLSNTINARLKKDGFKEPVNCNTCHRGEAKPKP
jgi:hypothetical protein